MTKPKAAGPAEKTQLLVVGGGPVGLCAALCAARRGLEVIVAEQNFQGYSRGHATILHPSSLRLLAELGLSQQLLSAGSALTTIGLHLQDGQVITLDLALPALTVPQTALEEILLKALHRETVQIRSSCEVTQLEQSERAVQVRVERRKLVELGSPAHYSEWQPIDSSLIEARFVIGADGYDSFVRSALAIENVQTGAIQTFAVFEGPAISAGSGFELTLDSELASAIFPLADQRTRWGFQLRTELADTPDLELLQHLLQHRTPWLPDKPERVDWSTVTHFERRLANRFGQQRVWLAGDAAHVTNPFGGQSMNGGLVEAHELVERMAECVFAQKPISTLEQWGSERAREWHRLLGSQAQLELQPSAPSWLHERAAQIIPTLPVSGRDLQHMLRELGLVVR